jgi:hypothetical protein
MLAAIGIALLAVAAAPGARGEAYLFDLGTAGSALREGFTRVTPETSYSDAQGYGWRSTEGLTARARAWSGPVENTSRGTMEPPPIYTNAITEDVIIGDRQADFLVSVPDGRYFVYTLSGVSESMSSQYYAFTVRVGTTDEPVGIEGGYRYEKRLIAATAAGGRLLVRFVPGNLWLANAILVWPEAEDARVRREIIEPLEQETFRLPPEEWAKWSEERHVDDTPMPDISAADRQRGYLVHHRHYLEPVYPNTVPLAHALNPSLRAFAAPGEYEPLTFTVYPLVRLSGARVEVGDLRSGRSVIPAAQIDVRRVRYMLARPNYRVLHTYREVPDALEHFEALDLEPEVNQRFWLTVHVPEDAAPGTYTGEATLTAEGAEPARVPITLRVLPIKLQEDPDKIFGIYYRHPYDRMASAPDDVSREYFRRKAELEHADMVAHGTRNVTLSASCPPADEKGEFAFSFDLLEAKLELWRKYDFKPPIVMSVNTGGVYRKYMGESYGSHLRNVKDPPQEFCDEMTAMVRALDAERQRRGWPEFLYYPVDEPGHSDECAQFMVKVLKAIKAAGVRTYVTAAPTAEVFDPMRPYVDVWCTQPFDPDRETILKDTRERGVEYWCYPNHVNGENDHTPVAGARMTYGFGLWRSGFRTLIPWIYQSSTGDPFNYLDGASMDFFNRSEPDGRPMPVALWEAYREGYDDYRYIHTLEQLISLARESSRSRVRDAVQRAERELRSVWDAIDVQTKYKYDGLWAPEEFDVYRWVVASQILELQEAMK